MWKTDAPTFAKNDQGARVEKIVAATGVRDGYCVVLGVKDGNLIEELLRQTKLRVIAVEEDPAIVERLRKKYARGVDAPYGNRVTMYQGKPTDVMLPPYLANLIVSERPATILAALDAKSIEQIFRPLRPYGGTACFAFADAEHKRLAALAISANVCSPALSITATRSARSGPRLRASRSSAAL